MKYSIGLAKYRRSSLVAAILLVAAFPGLAAAQSPGPAPAPPVAIAATGGTTPNLVETIARPMRYQPDGGDFVIQNGAETFNRPLYGGGTGFRVDGGDRPEFVLYLPGRGGNLRFGLASAAGTKWLQDAARIETRYRPGELIYEISDPLLGGGRLRLEAIAYAATEGLIVRIEGGGVSPGVDLVWAFGGVNGERGARDGDIGTERVPISQWFQLKPEFADGNRLTPQADGFTLVAPQASIAGVASGAVKVEAADAAAWGDLSALLASTGGAPSRPVAVGRMAIPTGAPAYLSLQRLFVTGQETKELEVYLAVRNALIPDEPAKQPPLPGRFSPAELAARFEAARVHFEALRGHVKVVTPDPYINAAMAALNVAAEGTWDEPQQAVMHGSIAWRSKLLGWRGPYWLDALGYPERADRHFRYWARGQNTTPIPAVIPSADKDTNLARNEAALHSNGDLSNSHYDMNTVYIDALFRHLEWSGDLGLARDLWPMIERHLAWERRLFRRPFGPEGLPLYEAYAVIWASDDLYYSGGGVTHASAYQVYHNRMAARVAALIGKDPAPYLAEANAIERAMRTYLWMPEDGLFAEAKDLLGEQRIHPSAGLWTYYHTFDSGIPTTQEAWRMASAMTRDLPSLPVEGPGVPSDQRYSLYATTDWMPYVWSINNVAMQENLHGALGLWQAGRPDEAFRLTKSGILASMFMGISPGNLGTLTYLDVYRRESQRDFADAAGVTSRTMVEGLFGIRPAALDGEITLAPGLPSDWKSASIAHPVIAYEFSRAGDLDRWTVRPVDARFRTVRLRLPAPKDKVAQVTVDGVAHRWTTVAEAVGWPQIEIVLPGGKASTVEIRWAGRAIAAPDLAPAATFRRVKRGDLTWLAPVSDAPVVRARAAVVAPPAPRGALEAVDLSTLFNDKVTNIFAPGKYLTPRSSYASLSLPSQGLGAWAGHATQMAQIDDAGLRRTALASGGQITTPQGVPFRTPGAAEANNIAFTSQWDNYPKSLSAPLQGRARRAHLLMAGSTNHMQSRFDNGEVVIAYTDGTTSRLALTNPTTWWPIEQDYFIDDYQFRVHGPLPQRVDLRTGTVRTLDPATVKGKGRTIPGGSATVLELALDPKKTLRSITVKTTANDVVVGLMAVTLERP